MKRRILSFVLTLCLLVGLLPAVALPHAHAAVESMTVTLFGASTTVNAGETLYWADDGTNIPAAVTADDEWNYSFSIVDDIPVVTLRNANYKYAKSFLYKKYDGSLKVKYEGTNNVYVPLNTTASTYRYFVSFASSTNSAGKGHLYILGAEDAVLNVTGGDDNNPIIEVHNKAYLTFSGGTLNIEKTNANGVISVIGAGYSKTTIENCNLTVKDNNSVSNKRPVVTLGYDSYGVTINNSNVTIENNGHIGLCLGVFQTNMSGVLYPAALTIRGDSNVKIVNKSSSTAYSYSGVGIYAKNVTVNGGSLEIEAKKQAVYTTSGNAPILSSYVGEYNMFTTKGGEPVTAYTATTYFKVSPPAVCSHENTTTTEEVIREATCGEAGSKKIVVACANCGELISEDTATIPATNEHNYDPITGICSGCGDVEIPIEGPTWPEDVTFATAEQMANVVLEKKASAGGAVTAHPGGKITYKIFVTNNNAEAINVHIEDMIPKGTKLLSGCDYTSGRALYWVEENVAPGETRIITYNVKPDYTVNEVRASETDIVLTNTEAKVMDVTVPAPAKDIWVLETFNADDRRRIEMGIDALVTANLNAKNSAGQSFSGATLIAQMYGVAFSTGPSSMTKPATALQRIFEIAGSSTATADDLAKAQKQLDMMVPCLYGGTTVPASKDSLYRGTRATTVTIDDLISGDVLHVSKNGIDKSYIVRGTTLVEVGTDTVIINIDPATVLPSLTSADQYVVLRPSINLATSYSLENDEYYNEYDKQEYTELEKALIATAEAYLLRGDRTQYDDGYMGKNGRFESLVRNPEDYTVDQYGYLDCSHFTYDLHWATYGYAAKATNSSGSSVAYSSCQNMLDCIQRGWNATTLTGSNKSAVYFYQPTGSETDAEKDAIYQEFISRLRPGDIVTYRYAGETGGHAMLYIGRGLLIHCTGSAYSATNKTDTHEAAIRFMGVDELFNEEVNARRYLFKHSRFGIVRPQNLTTPVITQNTANRVANLQGIVAEKISSTAMGKTVNCGDEITYTFYVFNTNAEAKIINISDVLSEHVTFVSATNDATVSGNDISWNITVPADTRISVSYTVKVKAGVAAYTAIDGSKATVNGVTHKCIDTYVANTLNAEQQQKIVEAVNTVKGMDTTDLNNVQVANLIYKTAFGVDNIFGENVTNWKELLNGNGVDNVGIFNDTANYSDSAYISPMDTNTSKAAMMLAPGMYGGSRLYTSSKTGETFMRYTTVGDTSLRSRYFWEKDLVVGDIFLSRGTSQETLFIYIGNDTFVALGDSTRFATSSVSTKFQYAASTVWYYEAILRPSIVLEEELNKCNHDWADATCAEPKTCKLCGATDGEALGHTEEIIPSEDATCAKPGLTEGNKCSVCGEILTAQEEIPATGHTYTNNSDRDCNTCGASAYPGGNTLVKENGVWYHVIDRQKVKDTTLVYYGGYWFYIKDGVINYSNTLCKWNGMWFHVKDGKVVYDTTLVNYGGYWFYVKNGVVDFNATTLCYFGSNWYYVKGGQVNYSNTLCNWNGKWWHVKDGKVVYDTTLVYFAGSWYYVKGGVLNYSNTLCNWNGKWWHVKDGKVVYDTTLVYFGSKWYYVKSGVVNYSNTLCYWSGKWWHVKNGTVVKDTTLVYFGSNWYYVSNGVVDFTYSGKVLFSGSYYTVKNGVKV